MEMTPMVQAIGVSAGAQERYQRAERTEIPLHASGGATQNTVHSNPHRATMVPIPSPHKQKVLYESYISRPKKSGF